MRKMLSLAILALTALATVALGSSPPSARTTAGQQDITLVMAPQASGLVVEVTETAVCPLSDNSPPPPVHTSTTASLDQAATQHEGRVPADASKLATGSLVG